MSTITLKTGISFPAKDGASILESANLANVTLPYSCKTGRCSTCKCKVLNGSTKALDTETGLTDSEKNQGWILSCVRSVDSDVLLDVEDLSGINLPRAKTLPCKIDSLSLATNDVLLIKLRLHPKEDFHFIPGQYVDIIGPNGTRRSYSIANSSFDQRVLEFHVRQVKAGVMSHYWFNEAKANDLLRLNGPLGTFFLRDTERANLIFLATGTGIAPVKSMLGSLVRLPAEKSPKSITVLWGGRKPEDLYMDLSSISSEIRYIKVLSRAGHDWHGERGYVQNVLMSLNPNLSDSHVYACGSDAMILAANNLLKQGGLPANRFFSDAFVCSASDFR